MNGINLNQLLYGISFGAIPLLFAITLHEVAHGRAARHFGDRTAELLGRLSLNPIKHIDPVGTILVPLGLLLLVGVAFGWAKPVPVGVRNLNNPKRDMIFVAAAGPAANLVMALGWALVIKLVVLSGMGSGSTGQWLLEMAGFGILINVLLCVFNLFPIPPLDGGRVLRGLVTEPIGEILDRIEPFGLIIIVVLLWSGLLWVLLAPMFSWVQGLILFLARI